MNVAILEDYQDVVRDLPCFELLSEHEVTVFTEPGSEADWIERLAGFDALVLIRERTKITEPMLAALTTLKVISQTGKAGSHLDPELCQQYGVTVLEGQGLPVSAAELCWALLLSAMRHIPAYTHYLNNGQWQQSGSLGLGRVLHGRTFGIWGYGRLGQRVAKFAEAFGMPVLVWGSEASRELAVQDGFSAAVSKAAFFAEADVVSLHLRLSERSRACVTTADLQLMKPDSVFVNISRAELVENGALYRELCAAPTKLAAIDVFDTEPATTNNEPLLTLPNVTATPHLGYVEQGNYEVHFRNAFNNLVAWERSL